MPLILYPIILIIYTAIAYTGMRNKGMKNKVFPIILSVIILFCLAAKSARAYVYEDGGVERKILVDKKIKVVNQSDWEDNLSADEVAFAAEEPIDFKIMVKNSGDDDLENIIVTDYFPRYVSFVFGLGTYNENEHKLEWTVDHLNPDEEKEFKIRVAIVEANQLPMSNATFSVVNKARAVAASGETDEDTAQFFIETRILAARVPEAGTNIVLGTVIALVAAGTGIIARKFGRGEIFG